MATTQSKPTDSNAQDLHPEDLSAIKLLYARVAMGIGETLKALRVVEAELNRIKEQPANVVPIARKGLESARVEYRKVLNKASQMAAALGVVLPVEAMTAVSTEGDDIGAVTSQTFGGGKLGEERFERMRDSILSGGVAPAGSFLQLGEGLALKAIAKLGARRAVQAAGGFARFSLAATRVAGRTLFRVGGKFITKAVETAIVGAVAWFAAAGAIRIAAPGIGAGLGSLFSSPGGLVLGAFALLLLLGNRRE